MHEQREIYDKLVVMEAALRDRPKNTDSRWSTVPPTPFPPTIFPFLNDEPDSKNHPRQPRVQMLLARTYMGQALTVPVEERAEGATEDFASRSNFRSELRRRQVVGVRGTLFHVRFFAR